jgi:hypothetical protein
MLTKGVAREKLSSYSFSVGIQEWRWRWEIFQVQGGVQSSRYNNSGVVVISLQVGDCWFWSLIIFVIQRFVSTVLGPHSLMGGVMTFGLMWQHTWMMMCYETWLCDVASRSRFVFCMTLRKTRISRFSYGYGSIQQSSTRHGGKGKFGTLTLF